MSIKLYREKKEEGLLFILIVAIYILFYAKIGREYYFGGTVWGPRYLIVILPYCVIVLGFLLIKIREAKKRNLNVVFGMVLIISIMVQVSSVSVNPMRYFYEMRYFYPKNYNEKIILDPRYSLLIGQWKSLYDVLSNMADTAKLKEMVTLTKAQKNFSDSSTSEILENALAINVPNFWWIYAWLYGIPKWMILSSLMFLVATVLISGKRILHFLT